MENKFTYPNKLIKMKFSKIFAINALNIKCLINHFFVFVVASFRARCLIGFSQCSLRGSKVDLLVHSTVRWLLY